MKYPKGHDKHLHMNKILTLLFATFLFTSCSSKPLPIIDYDTSISLQDQNNQSFTLQQLKGKVVWLYFGYTHCPDFCPMTQSKLSRAYKDLGFRKKNLQTVFVSLDPQRDTPEQIKKYIDQYKLDTVGLSGTSNQIKDITSRYKVFYQKSKHKSTNGYFIDHSTRIYLLDTNGKIRYLFRFKDTPEFIAGITSQLLPLF